MRAVSGFLFLLLIAGAVVFAQVPTKDALVGTWAFALFSRVQNGERGKPLELRNNPLLFTFHRNNTWEMHPAKKPSDSLRGTFVLNGSHLVMKTADREPYQDYQITLRHEGEIMDLSNSEQFVTAGKTNSGR